MDIDANGATLEDKIALGIVERDSGFPLFFNAVHGIMVPLGILHDRLSISAGKAPSVPPVLLLICSVGTSKFLQGPLTLRGLAEVG